MNCQELDKQLIDFTAMRNRKNKEYGKLEDEIESLEDDRDFLNKEICNLEIKIKDATERLVSKGQLKFSDNPFLDDFVKASLFAERRDKVMRSIFEHVAINDSHLLASNRFTFVAIKNDHIPEALKNTAIRWDVRQDFEENIAIIDSSFPETDVIIEDAKTGTHRGKFNAWEFYSQFACDVVKDEYGLYMVVKFPDRNIKFNKNYFDQALLLFGDSEMDFYTRDDESPVLMESEKITVVMAPMAQLK